MVLKYIIYRYIYIYILFVLKIGILFLLVVGAFLCMNRKIHVDNLMKIQPRSPLANTSIFTGLTKQPREKSSSIEVITKDGECLLKPFRHGNDGRWFDYSSNRMRFYAYSAFLDDRTSLMRSDKGVVRVTSMASDWNGSLPLLRCVLHYSGGRRNVVAIDKDVITIGLRHFPGIRINNELINRYLFACPFADKDVPLAVSFLTDPLDDPNTIKSCIPVELPEKPADKRDFAICVPTSYGHLNGYRLIEWMELQKLLGVSMVGMYNYDLDNSTLAIIQHYVAEGFVDLHETAHIPDGPPQVCEQYILYIQTLQIDQHAAQ